MGLTSPSRILRSFVLQTAERTSESVCITISDVRLVIRMIAFGVG